MKWLFTWWPTLKQFEAWRKSQSKAQGYEIVGVWFKYICLISLKRGHWVFAWRLAPGAARLQASPVPKNIGGLDVLVGIAG